MANDEISRVLIRERRAALAELGAMAAILGLIGSILTALSYLFLAAAVVYFLRGRGGSAEHFPSPLGLSGKLAIAAMFFVAIGTREELFAAGLVRRRRFPLRTNLESLSEIVVGLIMAGPRCLVISAQSALQAWKISRLELDRLWAPIDIALQYRRKIRQSDLGQIDIEKFIKDVEWLKGVVPLYAPPIGFVLTAEFRAELGDAKAFEEANKPNERVQLPGEPEPITERQWALITLELQGNPTPREIKQAYRRLAKIYHPDVRKSPEAEARMKNLNRPKEILGLG